MNSYALAVAVITMGWIMELAAVMETGENKKPSFSTWTW